jgi:hypothetical protein
MVPSGRTTGKKSPVTPQGIEPGTFRIVVQCLNHYAMSKYVIIRTSYKLNAQVFWILQEVKDKMWTRLFNKTLLKSYWGYWPSEQFFKSHGNFMKTSDQRTELSKQPMETSGQTVVLFILNYTHGIKISRVVHSLCFTVEFLSILTYLMNMSTGIQ